MLRRQIMLRRIMYLPVVVLLFSRAASDTTPPSITIDYVQPFIVHILMTVTLNEDGTVYCGVLEDTGSGTYVPSASQLRLCTSLDGCGSESVTGTVPAQVVVNRLKPATVYDAYCYAEDTYINGMSIADVTATKQAMVVTASGGDYVWPTLSYTEPFVSVGNTYISVYVHMSEDGRVWCVAKRDSGSGTTAPTASQIKNNLNVDAWDTQPILARNLYKASLQFIGLAEDTTYDVYCFAEDVAGNGIDRTPAFAPDPSAIANTKRAGIRTLQVLSTTRFRVSAVGVASVDYNALPATWNLHLPRSVSSGTQVRYNLESWNAPLSIAGAMIVDHTNAPAGGCAKLPAAPARGGPRVAVLRRGKCKFSEKAARAHRAGYDALVVIDHQANPHFDVLPEMTAEADDINVAIPAWIVSKADGTDLLSILAASQTSGGPPALEATDLVRRPRLSNFQSDTFGNRQYAIH